MLNRNKLYTKKDPDKDGKLYFIFCEGEKRETIYFYFFNRIASQIIIQIVPIKDGKNSPMGLYKNACETLLINNDNPTPTYNLAKGDEVWFVVDTDKWGKEIEELRNKAQIHNWYIAQSNPCFEVWLLYHFADKIPQQTITNMKDHLNQIVKGGFDTRKHPVYIETAITNAKANIAIENRQPVLLSTEVFILAERFLPLVKNEIDLLLSKINKTSVP